MMQRDAPLRIFLVDDHPMVRAGLATMIGGESGLLLVGEASDGREALRRIPECQPDMVLVDLILPHLDGVELIQALMPVMRQTRFVVLSSMLEPMAVRRAIQAGARGYWLKTATAQELVSMIHQVGSGRRVLSADVTDLLMADHQRELPGGDLTPRERQILELMVQGFGNRDIAQHMAIAVPTVKFHITNILGKLQVDSRTEAVVLAIRWGLVPCV